MTLPSLFGPEIAGFHPGKPTIPEAGGRLCPRFSWRSDGSFGDWLPDGMMIGDSGRLWNSADSRLHRLRIRVANGASIDLTTSAVSRRFPMMHRSHVAADDLIVESLAFSPIMEEDRPESDLPLHIIVLRCFNGGSTKLPVSFLLTWPFGCPEPVPMADFDYQHDKLCVSGSMGAAGSDERMGIAIPDPDVHGVTLHGMEPWSVPNEFNQVLHEFDQSGEISPRLSSASTVGAAAWIRSDVLPGKTWETAIILAWHRPIMPDGTEREYVRQLEKRRPDNAVVWLAEQAVQRFGEGAPNYSYWMRELLDQTRPRTVVEDDALWLQLTSDTDTLA